MAETLRNRHAAERSKGDCVVIVAECNAEPKRFSIIPKRTNALFEPRQTERTRPLFSLRYRCATSASAKVGCELLNEAHRAPLLVYIFVRFVRHITRSSFSHSFKTRRSNTHALTYIVARLFKLRNRAHTHFELCTRRPRARARHKCTRVQVKFA